MAANQPPEEREADGDGVDSVSSPPELHELPDLLDDTGSPADRTAYLSVAFKQVEQGDTIRVNGDEYEISHTSASHLWISDGEEGYVISHAVGGDLVLKSITDQYGKEMADVSSLELVE